MVKDVWIPYLAESYAWVNEYTLDVKLRPQAKWWDGKPITADDVKYTFELGKKYSIGWITPLWDYLDSVEVVDAQTVRIKLKVENLNYFALLDALHLVRILPKHRWEELERVYGPKLIEFADDDPKKIVGGGPYRPVSATPVEQIYERVDDWWGRDIFGLPAPKYLRHVVPKDNPSAAMAFEAGEFDLATHFFTNIWEMWTVKGLKRRTYFASPPYYIGYNIILLYIRWKHPLDNPALRRAIAFAIPYDELISKAYCNYSVRASPSFIIHTSPASKWIDESLLEKYGWKYDPATAKRILDEAGIIDRDGDGIREMPDGTRLGPYTIQVPYGWTDWMMMCEIIAKALREIGIDVRTEFPDFTVWYDRVIKGEFDFVIGWDAAIGYSHPWNTFRWLLDPRISAPAGNWVRYPKTDAIPIIDAIPRETDPAKLAELYRKLQEIAMKDLPGIPLFYGALWYEYSEDYWVGWPAEERPDVWIAGFYGGSFPDGLPTFFCLAKAGTTPRCPAWVTAWSFPTSKFFADLEAMIAAKAIELAVEELAERVGKTAAVALNQLAIRLREVEGRFTGIEGRLASLEASLGRVSRDIEDIKGRLTGLPTPEEIRALISAVEGVTGTLNTALALSAIALILALIALILPFVRKR
ncbi:MAG: ABC transporter substrate-binding protein [Thermofilaceae archaeon]